MKIVLKILLAFLYDLLLLIPVWFVATIPFLVWLGPGFDKNLSSLISFQFYLLFITYAYLIYFWLNSGQTPGLHIWKLKLVKDSGNNLTMLDANFRFMCAILLFGTTLFWLLFSSKKQFLHDQLAKTKIIDIQKDS